MESKTKLKVGVMDAPLITHSLIEALENFNLIISCCKCSF